MRIVVDKNIPYGRETFEHLGEVRLVETGGITARVVRDADALIIRSETMVNAPLLDGSAVRFVGTATIGTDHIDRAYLAAKGIQLANAPGCNANSVAEYIMSALLALAGHRGSTLRGATMGVVGAGNVGSKVAMKAGALGMRVLLNDPPLGRATGDSRFLPLDDLMESDFITLHVPLTTEGKDPTHHLFDADRMDEMKPGSILINTSRGGVVDGKALVRMLDTQRLSAAVLDVWENEPAIDIALLERAFFATAHIAGYSLDGKLNAVRMMHDAFCLFLGDKKGSSPLYHLLPPDVDRIVVHPDSPGGETSIRDIVRQCYDIGKDDERLKGMKSIPEPDRARYFRELRTQYRVRREFFATSIVLPGELASLAGPLEGLGFGMNKTNEEKRK